MCVFEHGVALIPVNERVVSGEGAGGPAFINTANVLPLNPRMLSTNYGSMWPESVILTPNFMYGVDTVAKKYGELTEKPLKLFLTLRYKGI